jgi:hypothetical protein
MKRLLAVLALLLLPELASAQAFYGSTQFTYWFRRATVDSSGNFTFPANQTITGGTITCGSASQACTFDAPSTTGPVDINASVAATGGVDVVFNIDNSADMSSADSVFRVRDGGTTTLFNVNGGGGIAATGDSSAGAGSSFIITGRSRLSSGSDGVFTVTNNGLTDFDQWNLGPATPADIGAVTVSCQNTGTAGCILVANTAASGGVDTGWIVRVVGDLANTDTAFAVQDNNGGGSLFTVGGTGVGNFPGGVVAGAGGMVSSGSIVSSATTSIGWSVVSAANQACTTTCTSAAVFGWDAGTSTIVDTASALSDVCVCAGGS